VGVVHAQTDARKIYLKIYNYKMSRLRIAVLAYAECVHFKVSRTVQIVHHVVHPVLTFETDSGVMATNIKLIVE
jgi:hypothetical protein